MANTELLWTSVKSMLKGGAFRSERFRRLSIEGAWIVFGNALVVLGSLATVRILTGLLSPSAYGELALALTLATLVNLTVLGALSTGVTRFYTAASDQSDLAGYLRASARLVLAATFIIVGLHVIFVLVLVFTGRTGKAPLVTATVFYALASGCNAIVSGIQNAARQRSIVAIHQGLEPWIRCLAIVVLLSWFGANATITMLGYGISVSIVLLSQCLLLRRTVGKTPTGAHKDRIWQQEILKYSWPFASWGLFYWGQSASDRWALQLFAGQREVGLYAVLYQIGYYPTAMVTAMAMQFLTPIFFQRAGDATDPTRNANVYQLSRRLSEFALGVTIFCFLLGFALHGPIFRLFVAKEYTHVSYLFPWMLLAGGAYAAGQTIALNLMTQMKTQAMMTAKIVTAVLGIMFNVVGAAAFGIEGIVGAAVLFSLIYLVWMTSLAKQLARLETHTVGADATAR